MFSWCCLGYMVVVSVLWCFCWWYNGWSGVMIMLMGCCYGLTWQYMITYIYYRIYDIHIYVYICILWYIHIVFMMYIFYYDTYICILWYISILQFLGWTFYVFFPNGSRNCCFVSVRKTQAMSQTQWAINRVEILSCFALVSATLLGNSAVPKKAGKKSTTWTTLEELNGFWTYFPTEGTCLNRFFFPKSYEWVMKF